MDERTLAEYIDLDTPLELYVDRGGFYRQQITTLRELLDTNKIPYTVAGVQSVVFCRDCKHKGWVQEPEHGKSVDYCRLIERCVDKQFFCAAGERKTNCGCSMEER